MTKVDWPSETRGYSGWVTKHNRSTGGLYIPYRDIINTHTTRSLIISFDVAPVLLLHFQTSPPEYPTFAVHSSDITYTSLVTFDSSEGVVLVVFRIADNHSITGVCVCVV